MIAGLLLPTIVLMIMGVLVTRGLERVVPETLLGLALNAVIASVILWLLSALLFAVLYQWQDDRVLRLLGQSSGAQHLLAVGAKAAIIWGPLMCLTVATSPRRWKTNVW